MAVNSKYWSFFNIKGNNNKVKSIKKKIIKFNSLPVYTTLENEDNRKLQTSNNKNKKVSIIDNTKYIGKVAKIFNGNSTLVNWVFHINMAFN